MIIRSRSIACGVVAGTLALLLSACSGGGGNTITNPTQCSTGTQEQLATPQSGQSGVSTSIGQIIVVANGNNNYLYNSYGQWSVVLTDNFGNQIGGGTLNLVTDSSGPHPFGSDYYYGSSIPSLNPGVNYTVQLLQNNTNCAPIAVGNFST